MNRTHPSLLEHSIEEDTKLCSVEAQAAIDEVKFGVKDIHHATSLPASDHLTYLNLTTLEDRKMCIEVSIKGFCQVGTAYDQTNLRAATRRHDDGCNVAEIESSLTYYETIYSLLSAQSPAFRDNFSQRLSDKLRKLQENGHGC